ncbi:MAG: hypothetical protein ABI183_09995 [Polyangiaceae bacterium]
MAPTATVIGPGGDKRVALIELPLQSSCFLDNSCVHRWENQMMKLWLSLPILLIACTHAPPPAPTSVAAADAADIPSSSAPVVSVDTPPPAPSGKSVGHTLTLSPKGFMQSCLSQPVVTIAESDGGTRVVDQSLPGKGNYYLDGKYTGYMMCDLVVCNAATDQPVDLIEYEKIGTRPLPAGQGAAPVYRTVDLKGKITIMLKYFADDKCSVPKTLTQTVVR